MDKYDAYLRSPAFPAIMFSTAVILMVYTRVIKNTPINTILDIVWCSLGGALVAICAPIIFMSIVPIILLTLWYHGWIMCAKFSCETDPYEDIIETGSCNPQC
jgi:hypothetical protein